MGSTTIPPDGGGFLQQGGTQSVGEVKNTAVDKPATSYSDKLKVNVRKEERLKRKVLEIHLENDTKGNMNLDNETVAKLCSKIGIDVKTQLEGVQVMPGNSKKIFMWLKDDCNIERFCVQESIKVAPGVKTGLIKPMDKKEVVVTIKGLNFNTPDSLVIEYINKHGKVTNNKVIYEVEREGPFKGIRNGNRKYLVDFTDSEHNLGSFHIIDGANVSVFFTGQKKTCGRCYKTAKFCLGSGFAKVCQENKGERVRLVDHMKEHWASVGFAVENFKLDTPDEEDDKGPVTEDVPIKDGYRFSPPPKVQQQTQASYIGVVVKNLPKLLPDDVIIEFLHDQGLPADSANAVQILESHKNKNVDIEGISEEHSKTLIQNINEKIFFNQKVYCRGLANLHIPKKDEAPLIKETPNTPTSNSPQKTPKKPSPKSSQTSHIPGLTQEEVDKAARKAARKEKEKENRKQRKEGKSEEKTEEKQSKNGSRHEIFLDKKGDEEKDTMVKNDNDWSWFPSTPNQLLQTPSFTSSTAKKVEKEERWKIALEKQTEINKKRVAQSPPEGYYRGRFKSVSGVPRLDLQSQQ